MGIRGTRPTPTAILRLRGSTLLPHRGGEPVTTEHGPATVLPEVAADPIASETYARLLLDLRSLGLFASEDYISHNHYALAHSEWTRANQMVTDGGLITDSPQGRYKNPAITVRDAARTEMMRLVREFGLTPASRVGLQSNKKTKGDVTGIEALLKTKT